MRWLAVLITLLLSGCNGLFFYPQRELTTGPLAEKFAPQDVFFKTQDHVTLHGWHLKAREPQGTILVLHGNAENLGTHVDSVLWLVNEGFSVFIVDYRGYGRSGGSPSIEGVMTDGDTALEEVFRLPGTDPERVAVLGQSLGGAIAVHAVATSPRKSGIKALIVESTFAGFRSIAREKLASFFITWPFQHPLSWLFNNEYEPREWIARVSPVPVLIIQGENDSVVSSGNARLLYDAALPPKELWMTKPPGHISSFADAEVRERLVRFLRHSFGMTDTAHAFLTVDKR